MFNEKEYLKKYNKERYQKLKNNPHVRGKRKETRKGADKKYRNNPKHKEEKKKRDKKNWQKVKNNIEYKKKKKEYDKEYWEKNKDILNKQSREYRKNNPDRRKETSKKYNKNHPEMIKKHNRKRRAMKNNIVDAFSDKEWLQKLKNTFGVCPKCNKYVGIAHLTLDHIKPISKAKEGQVYTIDDVQPLCGSCNSSKGNRE